jgi:hypothetical protein
MTKETISRLKQIMDKLNNKSTRSTTWNTTTKKCNNWLASMTNTRTHTHTRTHTNHTCTHTPTDTLTLIHERVHWIKTSNHFDWKKSKTYKNHSLVTPMTNDNVSTRFALTYRSAILQVRVTVQGKLILLYFGCLGLLSFSYIQYICTGRDRILAFIHPDFIISGKS